MFFNRLNNNVFIGDNNLGKPWFWMALLIAAAIFFSYNSWSFEEIGHPLEKSNYTASYYVNMFTEKNNSKNYRVKGEIEIITDCEDDYGCIKSRLLRKAFFPAGDSIEFDECFVELNKKEHCIDYDHKEWYVELTNVKVE